MVGSLHTQLVALYRWHPNFVWDEIGLFEGIDLLREGLRRMAMTAQMQGAILLSPLMKDKDREELVQFVESLEQPAEPVTIRDKFGNQIADEVEALEQQQRQWLKEHSNGD